MVVVETDVARREGWRRRWALPWPRGGGLMAAVRALDDRVDAWVERHRGPRLDPVFYGLSSAADHGLLWTALGAVRSARVGDPTPGLRLGAAMGAESALTNGPIKACFRRIRPPHRPDGRGWSIRRNRRRGSGRSPRCAATSTRSDSPAC